MVETNLPIIILRDIVLLPYNELRLELSSEKDKGILTTSELYHDNLLLLINLEDNLEEIIDINKLPKIGILAKIKSKIELSNGTVRLVLKGLDRVEVLNYLINEHDNYEAFVIPTKEYEHNKIEEKALRRIVIRDLNNYIDNDSYMSNSILGKIDDLISIDKLSDLIVSELPISYKEKIKYIFIPDAIKRLKLIIEDLNKETETLKLENDLEVNLKTKLDDEQKNFILREKLKLIKSELGELDVKDSDVLYLKRKLDKSNFPDYIKERINYEINRYEIIPSVSPEIAIIRNYIDWLFNIPWNDKSEENNNIIDVMKKIDESHYGLEDVKSRIIEYICASRRKNNSPILCLVGPPGIGKTTISKSIANALNKKFVKMSVGGITDEAEILGHRKAYMGSGPGKIINGLKKAKVNNPVFLIDEVDKMNKDYKGDPASALLEVLDKEQNKTFVDNYIEEEIDLSNVMFILTANDKKTIPIALLDRLEIIELSGYTMYEKKEIAKKYIVPKLLKEYNFPQLKFSDKAIEKIAINYTKEAGTRELGRTIDKIIRKVFVELDKNDEVKLLINEKSVEKYLGPEKFLIENDKIDKTGIVNAMAYTTYGGDILKVSVVSYSDSGETSIKLTGSLGEIMKESIYIALSFIKSNLSIFDLDEEMLKNKIFHIHLENAVIPKDGPSAGITIVTAILSLLKNKIISNNISMTGEITLRGKILPVGGIKEKIIAASINNIEKIYIPSENKKEIEKLPKQVKDKVEIVFVNDYNEIYEDIFIKNVK